MVVVRIALPAVSTLIRCCNDLVAKTQRSGNPAIEKIYRGLYGHDHNRNFSDFEQGRNPALLAPPHHARGRNGGAEEAEGGAGVVYRHWRPGLAAGALPGRRRRWDARPG